MARGQDEPSDPDEGPILSPDELDISDDDHVAEIDDGRYVVSPNDPISDVSANQSDGQSHGSPQAPQGTESAPDTTQTRGFTQDEPVSQQVEVTEDDVRDWLVDQFEETNSRYGFDVTAKFHGSVAQQQMVSNDVVTIFESLILWYAQQIDGKTPVEEVLGILLMEVNVPIRYPSASLRYVLESADLKPDDSIADLIEAVGDDGFRL